jgi:hypothetical protein
VHIYPFLFCHADMHTPDFERLGNPGWNWDNFIKYSNKSET